MMSVDLQSGPAPRERSGPGTEGELHADKSLQVVEMSGRVDQRTSEPGVYRRGSRYVVIFRDRQGRQHRRSARTLKEARDVKAKLRDAIATGAYQPASRLTFEDYAREWLDTYTGRTSRGLRPATLADYREKLERDAIPILGRMRLSEIQPRDIKRLIAHIASRGVAANTVRLSIAPVRAAMADAFEDGLIARNPTTGVRIAVNTTDEEAETVKALTEDELPRLLAEIPSPHRLFFALLAHTGLRVSEALALRWSDLDLGQCRLHVRRRLYKGAYAPPKSRYGRRTIPLSPGLAQQLWQARKASERIADGDLLFHTQDGRPLDRVNLFNRILKPAARRAGVPWCGFHTLRHTCASILFRRGLNAKQIQLWLGHHSPGFTLSVYVHLIDDDLPDAGFLDEVLHPQGGNRGVTDSAEISRNRPPRAADETA
jgi:integrase